MDEKTKVEQNAEKCVFRWLVSVAVQFIVIIIIISIIITRLMTHTLSL